MKLILVQSSLRKNSRTAAAMKEVKKRVERKGIDFEYIDLRNYSLPFCDGRSFDNYIEDYPDVVKVREIMQSGDGYIFGFPNYVYTFSGVFKNFIDIFGKFTISKKFGMVVNAGGANGYMASNNLISIMLYDFDATAIMPQVYTKRTDFDETADEIQLISEKPLEKIDQMLSNLVQILDK